MAETKIIYHIDEEETPYLVKIPIAAEEITLLDFKLVLNKPNYKFFFKSMDQDFGWVSECAIRGCKDVRGKSKNKSFFAAYFIFMGILLCENELPMLCQMFLWLGKGFPWEWSSPEYSNHYKQTLGYIMSVADVMNILLYQCL